MLDDVQLCIHVDPRNVRPALDGFNHDLNTIYYNGPVTMLSSQYM